jgi:hypothetical protein
MGDQRIAFHGRGGGFYLTKEDLRGENNGEPDFIGKAVSVGEFAIKREDKQGTSGAKACDQSESPVPGDSSSGVVGSGDAGRAKSGETNSDDNLGVLGWDQDEVRGSQKFIDAPGEVLANEQSSDDRDDVGMFNAAPGAQEKGS